jgi:hypothetical protein
VRRLADVAAQTASQLSADFGRLTEIREAVLLAEATGTSVSNALRDRIADLNAQRGGMRQHVAAIDRFMAEQRKRFGSELSRCTAMLLDGPKKIDALRLKVRTYEQAREAMIARLREAGLDDGAIQRAGIKPDADDLSAWTREIEDIERDVRLAQSFIESGPLYAVALLSEMRTNG